MPSTRLSRIESGSEGRSGPRFAATKRGRILVGLSSLVLLLLLWKLLALSVGKDIIVPSPERVLREAFALYPTSRFLESLWATFLRGIAAFGLSLLFGCLAGLGAGLSPLFDAILSPILTIIRATPVLALILVALIWFPSGFVPIFAAFLMAFPVMVTSTAAGVGATDPRLLEMARLFNIPFRERLMKLRLPSAIPHILAGSKNALGLSWKVVVAGEVLSQPLRALGTGMQDARVVLETPRVLAWAAAAVLLCGLTEWLFGFIVKALAKNGL